MVKTSSLETKLQLIQWLISRELSLSDLSTGSLEGPICNAVCVWSAWPESELASVKCLFTGSGRLREWGRRWGGNGWVGICQKREKAKSVLWFHSTLLGLWLLWSEKVSFFLCFRFLSILVAAATAATAKRLLRAGALENGEKQSKREISSPLSVERPLSHFSSWSWIADC